MSDPASLGSESSLPSLDLDFELLPELPADLALLAVDPGIVDDSSHAPECGFWTWARLSHWLRPERAAQVVAAVAGGLGALTHLLCHRHLAIRLAPQHRQGKARLPVAERMHVPARPTMLQFGSAAA